MNSQWLPSKRAVAQWTCLPPELLSIISGGLRNAADVIRFRSVCRSWRLSTPPLPNKVSPFFPLALPSTAFSPSRYWDPSYYGMNIEFTAGAVYILRPRRDPRKAWMVRVQESAPGKLVLHHALTLKEIRGGNSLDLDLTSDEWISSKFIARSYAHALTCRHCNGIEGSLKLAFLISNSSDPILGSNQLVRLGSGKAIVRRPFAFIMGGGCSGDDDESTITRSKWLSSKWGIVDFVMFKGRIYAIEVHGRLYVLDDSKLKLVQLNCGKKLGRGSMKHLVVWNGDLYVVLKYYSPENNKVVDSLECYRLVVEDEDEDDMNSRECKLEKVEDLGDGVLFITRGCSFSVSVRDLPHPWRKNSIVFFNGAYFSCLCWKWKIEVCQLGDAKLRPISSFKGYSALFAPPRVK